MTWRLNADLDKFVRIRIFVALVHCVFQTCVPYTCQSHVNPSVLSGSHLC